MDGHTVQEISAGANACSVEWCPIPTLQTYVACSTYLLKAPQAQLQQSPNTSSTDAQKRLDVHEGEYGLVDGVDIEQEVAQEEMTAGGRQTRMGTVVVHRVVGDRSALENDKTLTSSNIHLEETGRASLDGGVLDTKWSESPLDDGAAVLACATSTGRLALYALGVSTEANGEGCGNTGGISALSSSDAGESLLLSLDWSQGNYGDAKIVASQSDGGLAIWRPHSAGGNPIQETGPWPAHNLRGGTPTEAWISFFRRGSGDWSDANFVVSGADDSLMKGWDLRTSGTLPAFVCKEHDAGVTTGQWHPTREYTFVSGSYDERVRIWDSRKLNDPVSTVHTGGGLWRLKWHPNPEKSDLLLCACMHAGLRVLNTGLSSEATLSDGAAVEQGAKAIVARYTRHESMAYGADWCRLPESLRSPRPLVASCSFYDNLFCLWQTPLLQNR